MNRKIGPAISMKMAPMEQTAFLSWSSRGQVEIKKSKIKLYNLNFKKEADENIWSALESILFEMH